ncbi:Conjugal transfer protein TraG (plasmid) [Paludisphaera borealis]|uniref:Conjugal transfer protein TraG n=2 Tax=Paludisphaera borealis TaxID=1387353 RepID=A0A1U7CZB3_9BACT|nr:Conjugal transfer protein TraG [Paludisphaera borealis]
MFMRIRLATASTVASACRATLILALVVLAAAATVIAMRFPVLLMAAAGFIAWRRLIYHPASDAYGSASLLTPQAMETAGMLGDKGLVVGRLPPDPVPILSAATSLFSPQVEAAEAVNRFMAAAGFGIHRGGKLIRIPDYIHSAVFSPAGGGKNVGFVTPTLLSHPGNIAIIDPKGESFKAAAAWRKKRFGKKAYRLDPFEMFGTSHTLNPFDFIDPKKEDFLDQCRDFANPLIIRPPNDQHPHFSDMAELNLVGLTAFTIACETDKKRRHLGTVRGLSSSRERYDMALKVMGESDAASGVIRQLSGEMGFAAPEEQGSILTTFTRNLAFLDSPVVTRNVSTSSFDPMELKTGNADLYFILPHRRLTSLARLQRLWITSVMNRVTSGLPDESQTLLWVLDEIAHIGSIPAIEEATTLYRGMGMRLMFIFQSYAQVKTCFGEKASTILDNIHTQVYVNLASMETAQELSRRIGETTRTVYSENGGDGDSYQTGAASQGQGGSKSSNRGWSRSEIARQLLKPEEILTLPRDTCIILHKNLPACLGWMVRYYQDPEFTSGIGRHRRVGLAGTVFCSLLLVLSLLFGAFVAKGVAPPTRSAGNRSSTLSKAGVHKHLPSSPGGRIPAYPTKRRPSSRNHRSNDSGFLIKI